LALCQGGIRILTLGKLFNGSGIGTWFLEATDLSVHLVVFQGGTCPAVVLSHSPSLQFMPAVLMAEGFPGAHEGGVEVHGIETIEAEASAALLGWIVRWNRIHKTTHLSHYGHASVAHGEQLTDATGLKPTGHQEGVTSGVNQA
jgi:hypothetical protein